jgi:hypothetical protein
MQDAANIQRYTLATGENIAISGGIDMGRIIIRVTEDTRISLSELESDYNYIMFPAGTIMIIDPPNLLSSSNLWATLDSAASGVVEVLRC